MKCRRFSIVVVVLLWAALAMLGQPGSAVAVTPISGLSPFPDGGDPNNPYAVTACNGAPQIGVLYRNSETEPHLAVNPTNPNNMIAAWHQDRWSNGSAQGVAGAYTVDGGATWTMFTIPFTRCSGGAPGSAGDYERASDPWLTFGPNGAAYYMALVSDQTTGRSAMTVAKSMDGGVTWSDPIVIKDHDAMNPANGRSLFNDKNTMTADPYNADNVYATWTIFRNGSLALLFSRSTDGGMTWSAAIPVNKFEKASQHEGVQFRQGSQIVVLPDGTLVNVFYRFILDPRARHRYDQFPPRFEQAIFRSHDQGKHWERLDSPVADLVPTGALDLELLIDQNVYLPVRDAAQLPDIAVDPNSGALYVVWQDGRFSPYGLSSVVISRSTDGGATWSAPVPVHDVSDPFGQAFLPAVAVASDGRVGVLFYDFRNDRFGDAVLSTDVFLVELNSNLGIMEEKRLTDTSFDMRQMVLTGDRGYFPGDYVGLDAAEVDFVAAFTVANNLGLPLDYPQDPTELRVDTHNRQDIVFVRRRCKDCGKSVATRQDPGLAGGMEVPGKAETPSGYRLEPNRPNPFNPGTVISFEIAEEANVRLEIFDVSGRLVRTLAAGAVYPPGHHEVTWDGRNAMGQPVASGVYLYRLRANGFAETRRMVLMK